MCTRWQLTLLALALSPAAIQAQLPTYGSNPYPYNFGFTRGQYPYYNSPHFHREFHAGVWGWYPNQPASPVTSQSYYQPTPPPNAVMPTSATATLDVRVPDPNAQVWIEGVLTKHTGLDRRYVSPPLTPGQSYNYTIRALWNQNGRPADETQRVTVQAGQMLGVDFLPAPPSR